eukprot:13296614-Alexandrium_andersonii.AAC.1
MGSLVEAIPSRALDQLTFLPALPPAPIALPARLDLRVSAVAVANPQRLTGRAWCERPAPSGRPSGR